MKATSFTGATISPMTGSFTSWKGQTEPARGSPVCMWAATPTWRVLSSELPIRWPKKDTLPYHSGFHWILSASGFLKISCNPIWNPYQFLRWESTALVFLALSHCWHFTLWFPFSLQDRRGLHARLLHWACSVTLHPWVSKIKMQIRFLLLTWDI